MEIWKQFDKVVDVDGLKKDVDEVAKNGGDSFKEVVEGTYEVEVERLELKASKKNDPMLSCWMKIEDGEYKNSFVFYNQALTTGFGIHNANEFLRTLHSGIDVKFEDFKQYNDLLLDIYKAIDGKLKYALEYGKNKNGYNTCKVSDVFEE